MVGKKNIVVAVIGDLTSSQAADLQKQIVVAKNPYCKEHLGREV